MIDARLAKSFEDMTKELYGDNGCSKRHDKDEQEEMFCAVGYSVIGNGLINEAIELELLADTINPPLLVIVLHDRGGVALETLQEVQKIIKKHFDGVGEISIHDDTIYCNINQG